MAEGGDLLCQGTHTAGATFHQELLSGWSCGEEGAAAVVCILFLENEALFFESVDDPGHGGRANLFGGGKIAQGYRASEDDDGEGGQARGVEARAFIFLAELSQQVDGGGVELFGDILRICESPG